MDAGPAVEEMFGRRPGDAHVIRNAGGCVTQDALRSLQLSRIRGGTREIALVHHEDCAALSDPAADLHVCLDRIHSCTEPPHNDVVRGFFPTRGGAPREVPSPMIRPQRAE